MAEERRPYEFGNFEWFAIVGRGGFAFRFGPFDGPTIGKIMTQCVAEEIPLLVTANCGPEFNWEIARDFGKGHKIRAGDHVHHTPSKEDWVVAYVDGEYLAWVGWPDGEAKASDCWLKKSCTDAEHLQWLREIAKSRVGRRSRMAQIELDRLAAQPMPDHRSDTPADSAGHSPQT